MSILVAFSQTVHCCFVLTISSLLEETLILIDDISRDCFWIFELNSVESFVLNEELNVSCFLKRSIVSNFVFCFFFNIHVSICCYLFIFSKIFIIHQSICYETQLTAYWHCEFFKTRYDDELVGLFKPLLVCQRGRRRWRYVHSVLNESIGGEHSFPPPSFSYKPLKKGKMVKAGCLVQCCNHSEEDLLWPKDGLHHINDSLRWSARSTHPLSFKLLQILYSRVIWNTPHVTARIYTHSL